MWLACCFRPRSFTNTTMNQPSTRVGTERLTLRRPGVLESDGVCPDDEPETLATRFLRQHPHGSHCLEVFVPSGAKRPNGPAAELLRLTHDREYFPIHVTRDSRPPN